MDTARGAASKAIVASKAPIHPHFRPRQQDRAQQVTSETASVDQRRLRRGGVANVVVMTVAAGIVGTLAIPAYAFAPGSEGPQFGTSAETELTKAQAQSVEVTDDVIAAPVTKDAYAATTGEEIRAPLPRPPRPPRRHRQAAEAQMASYAAAYSGPSVGELPREPAVSELRPRQRLQRRAAVHRHALRLRRRHAGRLRLLGLRHVRLRAVRHQHAALVGRPGRDGHPDLRGRRAARRPRDHARTRSASTRATA